MHEFYEVLKSETHKQHNILLSLIVYKQDAHFSPCGDMLVGKVTVHLHFVSASIMSIHFL